MKTISQLTVTVVCALALTACGGGDGGGNDAGGGQTEYTVTSTVSGAGGTISPSSTVSVQSGATVSFTLTPNTGYTVSSVGGTCGGTLNGNTYTIKPVTANCTVTAAFTPVTYIVTTSAGSGGTVNPSGYITVNSGKTASLTVTPNAGYTISSIGGTCGGTLNGNTYTTNTVTANCTVVAVFAASTATYTVTPSVSGGTGGTISPSTAVSVQSGATTSFTVTPHTGYTVSSVDGTCGGTLNGNTYTTNAVTANCTVVVSFISPVHNNTLTFIYEGQPTPTDTSTPASFLALLNQEGARGYLYQNQSIPGVYNLNSLTFVNDGSGQAYTYEMLVQPGTMADFITQANTEGAKGYRFEEGNFYFGSDFTRYVLYRKDSNSSATYTYMADTVTTSTTAADFLTQANGHGQSGYWFYPYPPGTIGVGYDLYIKNNASNATYIYDVLAQPAAQSDFLAQLDSEGAKGYRALPPAPDAFGGLGGFTTVYVKDQTQTAAFTYQSPLAIATAMLNQESDYGAQGYAYWGLLELPGGYASEASYFVKASNCSGWLCTAFTPTMALIYATTGPISPQPVTSN